MENKNEKFHLRLNLFDGIVLVLALLVAGLLVWSQLKPAASDPKNPSANMVRYTICFQRLPEGKSELIEVGDKLEDEMKNFKLGEVVSYEVRPAEMEAFNQEEGRYIKTPVPGYEDILVTVESPCTQEEYGFQLDGGLTLRVGTVLKVRGEGYMANGPVVAIDREVKA